MPYPTRIAYVIDRIDAGGTGRQLQLLLEGLDRRRFEPTVFLLRGDTSHPFAPRGVGIEVLDINALMSLAGLQKLGLLIKRFRQKDIHIVQTFFQDSTFLGVLAARLARVPAVFVSIRDLLFWTTTVNFGVFRLMTMLADGVLVNSTAVKHRVERFVDARKIHVIPNGMPPPWQAPIEKSTATSVRREFGIPPGKPLAVLVANCNRAVKRVDLLIEAVPLILKQHPAHFMIVGDGHLRSSLEARARELGVARDITFTGQRQDIGGILAEADLAFNTSDSEGLSNSVMEAMQAGLPVVASNVEGNQVLIRHAQTGLLFEPGNFSDLADKTAYLLTHPDQATRLGTAAASLIAGTYSTEKLIGNHERLYLACRSGMRPCRHALRNS
jgi:glycosyltransferase involved in cell wall biosynthesis